MTTQQQKETLVSYLRMKVDEQDWHGVADAAMDLRELEIKLQMEDKLIGKTTVINVPPMQPQDFLRNT
jgi:hypothetical protein